MRRVLLAACVALLAVIAWGLVAGWYRGGPKPDLGYSWDESLAKEPR